MKVAIACDHTGIEYKKAIIKLLTDKGIEVKDFGTDGQTAADYPDTALPASETVATGACDFGILICGTGIGMSLCANKVKGIRCALCCDVFSAEATRLHNDANILSLGARVISEKLALEITDTFLSTAYSGEERHTRRIDKIKSIENKYFK